MPQRIQPWWLAVAAALAWAAAGLVTWQVAELVDTAGSAPGALTGQGLQSADAVIAVNLHGFAVTNPWSMWVARFFALAGSGYVLAPLTIVVVVLLARSGYRWWAMWVAGCGLGGVIISNTIKHLVDRQRPQWPDPLDVVTSPSFPSGHSMAGIYGYVVFGVVALAVLTPRWPGVALISFGVLMGPSRVLLGVHWTSDVLAGWLLATGWVCTVGALVLWLARRRGEPSSPATSRVTA